ncbi:MAG: hypothetical protein DCC71_12885 [Proteobacteria bacterium]|nr:MAG: hypothetical protein DCC71_12885 [Pseudomonadota bacterium]
MLAVGALLALACGGAPSSPPQSTVPRVDLGRYAGTWYEIASFPMYFQRGCVATTATYTPRGDGKIGVRNRCLDESFDGEERSVDGIAWPLDETNAKLAVQFFWPFTGDYWVIALDPDYRWAVVGHPERDYLWILSRTPQIDAALYDELVGRARAQGYDVSRLRRTPQPER